MDNSYLARTFPSQASDPGRQEAVGQGLAYGWGDELGASQQASYEAMKQLASLFGGDQNLPGAANAVGDTFNSALSENRDILRREKAREPVTAGALEAAGSVPLGFVGPGAKAAKAGAALNPWLRFSQGAMAGAKAAAPVGAVYGAGQGESPAERALGALFAGGTAAGIGGLLTGVVNAVVKPGLARLFPKPDATPNPLVNKAAGLEHEGLFERLLSGKPFESTSIVSPVSGEVLLQESLPPWVPPEIAKNNYLPRATAPAVRPSDSGVLEPLTPRLREMLGPPKTAKTASLRQAPLSDTVRRK